MFVTNCRIDTSETLKYSSASERKRGKKRKKEAQEPQSASNSAGASSEGDSYNAVKCSECQTVVGVIDSEEVVHFFNVLASY